MQPGQAFKYLPGASGGIRPPRWPTCRSISARLKSTAASGVARGGDPVGSGRHQRSPNLVKFFEDESCGQCTPCRRHREGRQADGAGPWNEALLTELSGLMRDASICGLGRRRLIPCCVFWHFPEELKRRCGVGEMAVRHNWLSSPRKRDPVIAVGDCSFRCPTYAAAMGPGALRLAGTTAECEVKS
jgi:hypothetical protein